MCHCTTLQFTVKKLRRYKGRPISKSDPEASTIRGRKMNCTESLDSSHGVGLEGNTPNEAAQGAMQVT